MQWLNKVVDEAVAAHPEGEILVSSGVSPSGVYHVGTLREVLTADAIMLGLRARGRDSRHIHVVDDLDPLRKIPAGVPAEFEKYFGMPLCDVPAPDGKAASWADYYFKDFAKSAKQLGMDMEIMRSHKKYRTGQTKKMSKSTGDTIAISDMLQVLPPEVLRYFVLRFAPDKQLFFDETDGVVKLIDDFAALLAKEDKSPDELMLIDISMAGVVNGTVSNIPFSHLVASYQAALKNVEKTLDIIRRTEHQDTVVKQEDTIKQELKFIDNWLKDWAPDDVKFELADKPTKDLSDKEITYLLALAKKVESAPADADGEWFHKVIYELKDTVNLPPKQLFSTLYKLLIAKQSGPRAGWFLSILPREWLVARLKLEA
jgi:lysyl-tRNA synthetase class I